MILRTLLSLTPWRAAKGSIARKPDREPLRDPAFLLHILEFQKNEILMDAQTIAQQGDLRVVGIYI